ncbi:sulfur oxidation c-type cytochrome SoxX [Rubrivivax albus]|uniref:Sulfur oxidation c-type cytochrome SoxX n=1 Tax=Rubrivivax albus TaxID=2499835 RepID=A0A437JXI9_9BURK|nr:sulfur oxidation c-type cytochrome SoxX [Rubrivivax albus]RVT52366.1 sulfur oxidation c-type cytochrome SoxX [Rubrivivax albus]
MSKKTWKIAGGTVAAVLLLAGCASGGGTGGSLDAQVQAMMKSSFRDQGIAKMDRLDQDLGQKACSVPGGAPADVAKMIEAQNLATVKWPAGGQYFGDFKAGEKLAQNGRGLAWNNKSTDPKDNGGNCYNCHQIDNKEISYGTIGPSLWNYGKIRGVKDVTDPQVAAIVQYTWGKLYNSKAYTACSNMPRFGHKGILNEGQIRDLMSLLLDPRSPVNQ